MMKINFISLRLGIFFFIPFLMNVSGCENRQGSIFIEIEGEKCLNKNINNQTILGFHFEEIKNEAYCNEFEKFKVTNTLDKGDFFHFAVKNSKNKTCNKEVIFPYDVIVKNSFETQKNNQEKIIIFFENYSDTKIKTIKRALFKMKLNLLTIVKNKICHM